MKKNRKVIWIILCVLALAGGCQTKNDTSVTPTMIPTTEPTATEVPVETPIVESTVKTDATVAPTPTETPDHEHMWLRIETDATCVLDGGSEELCMCGEKQNVTVLPAFGHTVERKVTKEVTVEEEGAWEEVYTVCGEVVDSGTVEKLVPTATPSPTSTPKPTATPKPTTAPTPVTEECKHTVLNDYTMTVVRMAEETDEEKTYQICADCGKIVSTSTVQKEKPKVVTPIPAPTATPTPTMEECKHTKFSVHMIKETDTEETYQKVCAGCGKLFNTSTLPKTKPVITITPTDATTLEQEHGEIVDVYYDSSNDVQADVTVYADGTKEYFSGKDGAYVVITPDGLKTKDYTGIESRYGADETLLFKECWRGFEPLSWECLYKMTKVREDRQSNKKWMITYYIYVYEDKVNDVTTAYLCNSDGSKNKYSEHIFAEDPSLNSILRGYINNVYEIKSLGFGYGSPGAKEYIIPYTELTYYDKETGEIHLYEY